MLRKTHKAGCVMRCYIGKARAGAHGFSGPKSATVLLAPGVHTLQIDYSQVLGASPSASCFVHHSGECQGWYRVHDPSLC